MAEPVEGSRSRSLLRIETALVWLLGHASRLWPFIVFAVALVLSWEALRQIRPRAVHAALQELQFRWIVAAGVVTTANIIVMGLYDVIAFRHTRSRWSERWRYGAVAFAWSNFLTLGPLAGPAIRFWLYRPNVDAPSDLHAGVGSIGVAFTSGLIGWTLAVLLALQTGMPLPMMVAAAFVFALLFTSIARAIIQRADLFASAAADTAGAVELALVGWLDWLLAAVAFLACVAATGTAVPMVASTCWFFLGQVLGLLSFVPGGFGSADAIWIAHLPLPRSSAAAALVAYRAVYYVVPWAIASLLLLAWVTRRAPRRLEVARRIVAGLVGGGGVLIMLSSASPALFARLVLLEQFVPLPLVEAGQAVAALAGLLLLVLARGLGQGYRAAYRATLMLLTLAGCAAILKGLDWEEAAVAGGVAIAAWSQSPLFDRRSRGVWLEGSDLVLAAGALVLFMTFGTLAHHLGPGIREHWTEVGYQLERARFIRTAAAMTLALAAGMAYVLMRTPVRFTRLSDAEIAGALDMHARIGSGTNALMVASGDKAVFFDGERGFCLYGAIGPYLVVFSDPVVRAASDRHAFLDALFAFAGELDRRPVFYQISLDWVPALHDRGYDFFKLGEEAHVHLDRVTLEGHAGKMYRQILRRADRDGVKFRILDAGEIGPRLETLKVISDDWLRAKRVVERQFSIGFFDPDYLCRFRCAVVEEAAPPQRVVAFANLLESAARDELSVDLMRYRSDAPPVMDFLLLSLMLNGKAAGYRRFNLGMAPFASVGELPTAHARERLARVLFQRGEQWYNFQGLRLYKQKFDPEWVPRYMAYQNAWEWPVAIAYVAALIAGGWSAILVPVREKLTGRQAS